MYVIFRDGTLLLAVIIGLFTLNPDLMADIKIGLPFVPLGTVALAAALVVKVFRNAEDVNKSFRLATWLVAIGLILNTIGFVFVMEAPGEEYNLGRMAFWQAMRSWRSNANPNLSMITFYISALLLSLLAVYCFVKAIKIFGKANVREQSSSQVDRLMPSYSVMEK
jgi:hypothetical protein